MQEGPSLILGQEDPLEKGILLQYSGLENTVDYMVMGSQKRSWTDLGTFTHLFWDNWPEAQVTDPLLCFLLSSLAGPALRDFSSARTANFRETVSEQLWSVYFTGLEVAPTVITLPLQASDFPICQMRA